MDDKQQREVPFEEVLAVQTAFAEGLAKARTHGPVRYREKEGSAWGEIALKYGAIMMISDRTTGDNLAGILVHRASRYPLTIAADHRAPKFSPDQVWELSHLWSLDALSGGQLIIQVMQEIADAEPPPKLVAVDIANPNLINFMKALGFEVAWESNHHPYLEQLDGTPLPVTNMDLSGAALEKLVTMYKGRRR